MAPCVVPPEPVPPAPAAEMRGYKPSGHGKRCAPSMAFCRDHRPFLPTNLRTTERERVLVCMWKALPEAERNAAEVCRSHQSLNCEVWRSRRSHALAHALSLTPLTGSFKVLVKDRQVHQSLQNEAWRRHALAHAQSLKHVPGTNRFVPDSGRQPPVGSDTGSDEAVDRVAVPPVVACPAPIQQPSYNTSSEAADPGEEDEDLLDTACWTQLQTAFECPAASEWSMKRGPNYWTLETANGPLYVPLAPTLLSPDLPSTNSSCFSTNSDLPSTAAASVAAPPPSLALASDETWTERDGKGYPRVMPSTLMRRRTGFSCFASSSELSSESSSSPLLSSSPPAAAAFGKRSFTSGPALEATTTAAAGAAAAGPASATKRPFRRVLSGGLDTICDLSPFRG